MLGPENYTKLICENNPFLHNVITIPLGDFQHVTLEIPFSLDSLMDIDQTMLCKVIKDQTWCISTERMSLHHKVILTIFKDQLQLAHRWIDQDLPALYDQHISNKINVTTLQHLIP